MVAARKDFIIEKGAKFYKEFQIVLSDGTGKSLVGKKIRCVIKESSATTVLLYELTELNGGIVVIDDSLGHCALYISAEDTLVDADFGVYVVEEIDETYPDDETEWVMRGNIKFVRVGQNG